MPLIETDCGAKNYRAALIIQYYQSIQNSLTKYSQPDLYKAFPGGCTFLDSVSTLQLPRKRLGAYLFLSKKIDQFFDCHNSSFLVAKIIYESDLRFI